jgi:hypothetical protein
VKDFHRTVRRYDRRMPISLVCPRISPQWELAARLALVKPKPYTKNALTNASPRQKWSRRARRLVEELSANADATAEFPARGEHHFIIKLDDDMNQARRFARQISRALPDLWFILDGDHLRGGVFYQRTGKYNLELIPTTRMRLRRSIRWGYFGDLHALTPNRRRARQDQAAQPDR